MITIIHLPSILQIEFLVKRGGGFSIKYLSQNTKEQALGAKGKISELASKKAEAKEALSESGGLKSKSITINKRSFADSTRRSRLDLIYQVRDKDQ